ncbi:MAG: hypothetical protein V1494_01855 [Candidatus Diapherotrites archaeon]
MDPKLTRNAYDSKIIAGKELKRLVNLRKQGVHESQIGVKGTYAGK